MKRKEKEYYWQNRNWGGKKVYFSDEKQNYVKPAIFWKILTFGINLLAMLLMVLIVYYSKPNNEVNKDIVKNKINNQINSKEKLKICPEKWSEEKLFGDTPCDCNENGCEACQSQYVLIKGVRYNLEKIDVPWMIQNCNITFEPDKN